MNRNQGDVSSVTRRETKTQTTNHALTDPTGIIEDLAGSLTGSNGGRLGQTDQYNNRKQVRLGGRPSTTTKTSIPRTNRCICRQ